MTGPVVRLALSLQRQLKEARRRNTILSCAYARVVTQRDVLSRELEQVRRDCDLLALCAKDRQLALSLVRDSHTISKLEET